MLLASVTEVRDDLGFDDMTDITYAITEAMHAAEVTLGTLLNTSFERADHVDLFWAAEPGFSQPPHHETQLRLRHGFVLGDPVVKRASAPSLFDDPGVTLMTGLLVDRDKGTVKDVGTRFSNDYLQVAYTAGFEAQEGENADSYKLDQVPLWLQKAAKLLTKIAIVKHPSMENAGVELDAKALREEYATLVNGRVRYAPVALLPL